MLILGKRTIEEGTTDAPITVFERVNELEPSMGQTGARESIHLRRWLVEPVKKAFEFPLEPAPRRRLIVNLLPTGAETIRIGEAPRNVPTRILASPERPVGKSAACQLASIRWVSGLSSF
ncbi:MAG TPA: hypothetical protein VIJ38_04245, partial [Acidobacteriaceae bacterium]